MEKLFEIFAFYYAGNKMGLDLEQTTIVLCVFSISFPLVCATIAYFVYKLKNRHNKSILR